jgi:hypothetical protein
MLVYVSNTRIVLRRGEELGNFEVQKKIASDHVKWDWSWIK